MTIQEIISNLVKNRWSYGDIARQSGVSKATISRWHKGTVKANKNLEQIVEKNLKDYVDRDKFDDQAGIAEYFLQKPIFIQQVKPIRETIELVEKKNKELDKEIEKLERKLAELKKQKAIKKWRFTEDEKVILRNLDKKFKWIARDNDNYLYIYQSKPEKSSSCDEWHTVDIEETIEISELGQPNKRFFVVKMDVG